MKNRIIVFGIGGYYAENKKFLDKLLDTEVIGLCDNNEGYHGKIYDGHKVYGPSQLSALNPDFVLLMSTYACEIYRQLLKLGIDSKKIKRLKEYIGYVNRDHIFRFIPDKNIFKSERKKSVAIISDELNTNGGSLAAKYVATALKEMDYRVMIAAPSGKNRFVESIVNEGIEVCLYAGIEFSEYEDMPWLQGYDIYIVNTFQMYHCIYHITGYARVIWWLHESSDMYENDYKIWGEPNIELLKKTETYAVSEKAKLILRKYYPDLDAEILEIGIPEVITNKKHLMDRNIFAVIGNICEIKGQDIFINAVSRLEIESDDFRFLIIGKAYKDVFCKKLTDSLNEIRNIEFMDEVDHDKLFDLYKQIDVVVIPSRSETMSLTAIEALMLGKPIIISDAAGIVPYLNKDMAVIFPSESIVDLAESIEKVLQGYKFDDTKMHELYKKVFSMDALTERLKYIIGG